MIKEVWKDIKGYEGLYQISSLGRVKSIRNNIIKKPSVLPKGYLQICLNKKGKSKYISIHRLVAQVFISNPNNLPCVNHKDCNPQNNNISNLEWISYKDNNNYKNHHLKRNVASAIYFLKRDYPNEKEIIEQMEEIKRKIKNL